MGLIVLNCTLIVGDNRFPFLRVVESTTKIKVLRGIKSDAHVQNYDKIFSTHIFNGRIQVFSQETKNFTEVKTQISGGQ